MLSLNGSHYGTKTRPPTPSEQDHWWANLVSKMSHFDVLFDVDFEAGLELKNQPLLRGQKPGFTYVKHRFWLNFDDLKIIGFWHPKWAPKRSQNDTPKKWKKVSFDQGKAPSLRSRFRDPFAGKWLDLEPFWSSFWRSFWSRFRGPFAGKSIRFGAVLDI